MTAALHAVLAACERRRRWRSDESGAPPSSGARRLARELAQQSLGVVGVERRRNRGDAERAIARKLRQLEAALGEILDRLRQPQPFAGRELEHERLEQTLAHGALGGERAAEPLVEHALVRDVLIDQIEAVGAFEQEERSLVLAEQAQRSRRVAAAREPHGAAGERVQSRFGELRRPRFQARRIADLARRAGPAARATPLGLPGVHSGRPAL